MSMSSISQPPKNANERIDFELANEPDRRARLEGRELTSGTSYRSRPGCEPDAGQARRGPALTRHFMTTCGGAGQIPRGPRRIARFCGVEFRMIVAVMRIDLIKYQALGNDYLVLDLPGPVDELVPLLPILCDRHRGLGSDGLLAFDPPAMSVRIFNPDGSEAQKSGNGLRITAAHAVLEHGAGDAFDLHTIGRANPVRVLSRDGAEVTTELDIGRASFRAADLPARFDGEPDRVHLDTPA